MTLYHGSHNGTTLAHEGMCMTDREDIAEVYAQGGTMTAYDLPEWAVVEDCDGYDWDTNNATADCLAYRQAAAARGVDLLRYSDADECGREHTCYRLVSDRIVAALFTMPGDDQ